ncbi:hypothetical protein G7Y89_g7708 [Cudoniella acicularis]|uniref:Uncharacterized protein n=1 Tax=Cudoniella acicularis TaxID=354080 RepID=A0A8H4RK98_9HELO|nr:hypothetical protein G7Y89_g7708 [Cudoniella acicularis]
MNGHNDRDASFSDHDFDDLPDDTLALLESNAIQFTQAQTQARTAKPVAAPSSDYGDEFDDEEFEIVIDESRSTPVIISGLPRNQPGQATQREQFRQQRYGTVGNSHTSLADRPRNIANPPPRFTQPKPPPARVHTPQNELIVVHQGSQPSFIAENANENYQKQIQEVNNHKLFI